MLRVVAVYRGVAGCGGSHAAGILFFVVGTAANSSYKIATLEWACQAISTNPGNFSMTTRSNSLGCWGKSDCHAANDYDLL